MLGTVKDALILEDGCVKSAGLRIAHHVPGCHQEAIQGLAHSPSTRHFAHLVLLCDVSWRLWPSKRARVLRGP